MAGEKKGKAREALVYVVLQRLQAAGRFHGDIFWNVKPSGMTIEPDFTIGKTADAPGMCILVTHSGSAKDSDKKFWRNAGELAEAKSRLPLVPRVVSIAFETEIKPDLATLQQEMFDGQLMIGHKDYSRDLFTWLEQRAGSLPRDKYAKSRVLEERILSSPPADVAGWLKPLSADLGALLQASSPELATLWQRLRARTPGRAPGARSTFLRRGMAKALVLGDLGLVWPRRTLKKAAVPAFCYSLGFFRAGVGSATLTDRDLKWLRDHFSREGAEVIVRNSPVKQMAVWVEPLRALDFLDTADRYVRRHWTDLITPKGLYERLVTTSSPEFIRRTFGARYVPPGWLFEYCRDLLKAAAKRKAAWGWSVLISDLKALEADADYKRFVSNAVGIPIAELATCWSGLRTVTYAIPEWVMGESRANFPLKPTDLPRLAYSLAPRIAKIPGGAVASLRARVAEYYVSNYLEAKLIQYKRFSPLRSVIEDTLRAAHLPFRYVERYPSAFVDRATAQGRKLNVRTGKTAVLECRGAIINWQSAHDSHTNDKRKELCGRAVAVRYTWDPAKRVFVPRPHVEKTILVVDGTWCQEDLSALAAAGWDEVLYPDELERLPAIV